MSCCDWQFNYVGRFMQLFVLSFNLFIRQRDSDCNVLFGGVVYGIITVVWTDNAVFASDGIEGAEQFKIFRKFFFYSGTVAVVALVALGVGEYGFVSERFGDAVGLLAECSGRDALPAVTANAFVFILFSDVGCTPMVVGIDVIAVFNLVLYFQKVAQGVFRIRVIPDYQ